MGKLLTKTRFINGLQCQKLLWHTYNKREDFPPLDVSTQAVFDQGIEVGLLAQQLFPDGVKLQRLRVPQKHSEQSIEALKLRKPLFEAGFLFKDAYALADILNPVDENSWEIIEVKSSTQIKDEHYEDLAFQKYVYEGAGLNIKRCFVLYINNEYVRRDNINLDDYFKKDDISKSVSRIQQKIEDKVTEMLKVVDGGDPIVSIGPHCDSPYECRLKHICWDFLPNRDSIFTLSRGKKIAFSLLNKKILKLTEIPDNIDLTDNQMTQIKSHRSGEPLINKPDLRSLIDGLEYPLYFLDFETISPAIPLFKFSRPYERIPFQYAMYVLQNKGSVPQNSSFLWKHKSDPRPEFLRKLKDDMGDAGSIIAYNAAFEIGVLKSLCETFPEYSGWFENIKQRFFDLYQPFRNFLYYHPDQQGKASIKVVLPILTGKNYEKMNISSGDLASLEYFRATFKDVKDEERQRVYLNLKEYCDLDTHGMIDLLKALEIIVKE